MSKALKIHPKPITLTNPKKEATMALAVIIAVSIIVGIWRVFYNSIIMPSFQLGNRPAGTVEAIDVLLWAIFYGIAVIPVFVALRITGKNLESIGVKGNGIGRMVVLGLSLSLLWLIGNVLVRGGFSGFSLSLIYDFILGIIVGFVEETIWRGYIQTRLVAYSGTVKGLIVTTVLFAFLWHFPRFYFESSGVLLEALASSSMA